MKLVVVESPKKARTISGFLGTGYRVAASMGHVRDLPPKALGIDVGRDFAPQYEILPRARKALAALRRAAAGAESILLATDPDREGEAIAWHLVQALRLPRSRYRRITFHEISRRAIQEALSHPRDLDLHLIDAWRARRVLDRLVGYELSPLLWRKVQRGTSAGRVQSVAVRLIVDREREIAAFVPVEYWTIDVRLSPLPGEGGADGSPEADDRSFLARLQEIDGQPAEIKEEATARRLEGQLRAASYRVRETGEKTLTRSPWPPFTTSTLQQAASNRLRWPAKKTMAMAQALYEAGLVTYMRTDSVSVSPAAVAQAREVITAQFGPAYVPATPPRYRTRTRNAQEAHEAIRPVDLMKSPAGLRTALAPDEWRLYELIWKRMIASQMAPARYRQDVAIIDGLYQPREGGAPPPVGAPPGGSLGAGEPAGQPAQDVRFTLKAQATDLVFPGWLAAYGDDAPQSAETPANDRLPTLESGEPLRLEDVMPA
ncbi:MAG TPA: type I DNA topoisomerase, partial [Chloroflexota bacterium]|nr:type I DNA topoisomerase [Chloroflexota bacterium]